MRRTSRARSVGLTAALFAASSGMFPAMVQSGGHYHEQTSVSPDSESGGWFINLGITGARGRMSPDRPKEIEVAHVFKRTPAAGKLEAGDRILGANGRRFTTPHKFGYGMEKFGYEGPLMDLGNAIDESQGSERGGKLVLQVDRGGDKIEVGLDLPTTYGSFSESYPWDCPKTDKILEELYAYLADRQRPDGSWTDGRPHVDAFAALSLLASGETKYRRHVKSAMRSFADRTDDEIGYGGLDCWKYGLYGVCLAEYHLATGESWVLKELEEINRWLVKAQFSDNYRNDRGKGGWGHRPANKPGGNGYGPICMITAQAMAAWSLMAGCGIEIDRERYDMAHEFLVAGTNDIGYVWYADSNGGDGRYADMGRTGASVVAHAVSPFADAAYERYARKSARCIGENPDTFPDTHGSPILGMGWTALGASFDEKAFRQLMDEHVWYLTLAHCPDGTFYYQPNRDNNAQDFHAAPRLSASAAAALIFSIKNRSLRVANGSGGDARPSPPAGGLADRQDGELRKFLSADGKKSINARYVAFDPASGVVRVRVDDGQLQDIPFLSLSENDREYVKQQWSAKE